MYGAHPVLLLHKADLDRWLAHDNTGRSQLSYRTAGARPLDTVNAYSPGTKEASW